MPDLAASEALKADLAHLAKLNILFRPAPEGPLPEGGTAFERYVRQSPQGLMPLGAYSYTNSVFRPCKRIGRYSSIATNVRVMGASHPVDWASSSPVFYRSRPNRLMGGQGAGLPDFAFRPKAVTLGNDVWIGQDVLLSAGVTIGDGAIVAAGSVVTKSVAPYTIVGGAPAQVIRARFDAGIVDRMATLAWWQYGLTTLEGLHPETPEEFLDALEGLIADGKASALPEDRRSLADWLQVSP